MMDELKPYVVEFNEDDTIKDKEYPKIWQPIIGITYNKYIFSTNNSICKAWTQIGDIFLQPKKRGQSIMVSEFLLPFGQLNLLSLFKEKQKEVIEKMWLTIIEVVELFEYKKNNKKYWDRAKLYNQVVNKVLSIAKAFYPGYSLLFLFNKVISHFVYANNALRIRKMNKSFGGK